MKANKEQLSHFIDKLISKNTGRINDRYKFSHVSFADLTLCRVVKDRLSIYSINPKVILKN